MKKSLALACIFIFSAFVANGQSTSDEVQRLQQRLKEYEQLALQAEARAKIAEEHAKRMRCLALANELAERTDEIQEKELSALLSVQAYNFYLRYDGYSFNGRIYTALLNALKKHDLIPNDSEAAKSFLKNTSNKPISSAVVPSSNLLVVAEQNGNLRIMEKGIALRILSGHHAQVDQISFSHSGKLMATSGKDNTIRIWNLNQLNVRPMVIKEEDQISKLAFSEDDNQMMYAVGVKKVAVKQLPLDMKLMALDLCSILNRNLTAEEWRVFIGDDLPYEQTCTKYSPNNK